MITFYQNDSSIGEIEIDFNTDSKIGDIIEYEDEYSLEISYLKLEDIWNIEDSGDYEDICYIFTNVTKEEFIKYERDKKLNHLLSETNLHK